MAYCRDCSDGSGRGCQYHFRKEIKEAANPEEMRKQKVAEYREKFANPYVAASKGYIDSVIEPSETRMLLKHSIEGVG